MTLEALVGLVVTLNLGGGIAFLFKWWKSGQEKAEVRRYTDADQVRAVLEADKAQQQERITNLEQFVTASNAAKDKEVIELKAEVLRERADVADCRKQHAEARIEASAMRMEVAGLRQQVEDYVDENADLKQRIVFNLHKIETLGRQIERRGVGRQEKSGGKEAPNSPMDVDPRMP